MNAPADDDAPPEVEQIGVVNASDDEICVVDVKPRSQWTDAERVFQEAHSTVERPLAVVSNMEYTLPADCVGLCLKITDCNARIQRTDTGAVYITPDRVAQVCVDNGGVIGVCGTPGLSTNGPNLCALGFEVRVTGGLASAVSLDCSLTPAATAPGGCACDGAKASVVVDAVVLGRAASVTAIGYEVSFSGPITCQTLTVHADDGCVLVPDPSVVGNATIIATRSAAVAMLATFFKYSCVARAWDKATVGLGIANRLMLRGSARTEGVIYVEDARAGGETERYPLCIRSP